MAIAASGTIIEWFDFSLFFYVATALTHTFYPGQPDSLILVLATGAVGFLFRPLGAVVFGHLGDTRSRVDALVLSTVLMAIAMAGIALMPGYEAIGPWGGLGVLAMRALAGFSVGAEYTGIMVYLTESAAPHRRARAASWAAANSEVGALLAVGSSALIAYVAGEDALVNWAWRIPFALGAAMALAMLALRRSMIEPPEAVAGRREETGQPVRHALSRQHRAIVISFLISTVGSATYFLTITYLPTYIETVHGGQVSTALGLGTIGALTAILVTPLVGWLTDAVGARRAFVATLLAVFALALPGYALLARPQTGLVAAGAIILAAPTAAWSAIAASAVPVQFGSVSRFSGMALGYNMATTIFGGLTPAAAAWLTRATGTPLAPAYYASVVALLAGIPAIALMREQMAGSFDDEARMRLGRAR